MPKKFRYSKPKTSTNGMTPVAYWTQDGVKNVNEFMNFDDRMQRARELVSLEAAEIARDAIQLSAPRVDGEDYANDLKIVLVEGGEGEWTEGAAVVHHGKTRKLEGDDPDTALYISPKTNAPAFVGVLKKYGPWPASLLPVKLDSSDARVIARRVTSSEIQKLTRRIMSKQGQIEADLKRAGLNEADLTQDNQGIDTEVQDDLAFAVLRYEFGIQQKQIKHWNPGLKEVDRRMNRLAKKMVEYVSTGREGVFSPPKHDKVSPSDLDPIQNFQSAIVKASGF